MARNDTAFCLSYKIFRQKKPPFVHFLPSYSCIMAMRLANQSMTCLITGGVGHARFRKALSPQTTAIALATGASLGHRPLAGNREAEVHSHANAGLDDLGFAQH